MDLSELIVYHRGAFRPYREATLGLLTHALQYGTGCFEGIRGFWNDGAEQLYVFEPAAHYRRLRRSGNVLLMDLPLDDEALTEITLELCRRNDFRCDVYIRPLLFKSEEFFGVRIDDVGHDLAIVAFPNSKYLENDGGLKLCVSSWRRVDDNAAPARAKITGSYVNVALAKSEARLNGFDDAIVLSDDGHVSEASAANLFVVREGVVTTPDLSQNLLEGITRKLVTRFLREDLGLRRRGARDRPHGAVRSRRDRAVRHRRRRRVDGERGPPHDRHRQARPGRGEAASVLRRRHPRAHHAPGHRRARGVSAHGARGVLGGRRPANRVGLNRAASALANGDLAPAHLDERVAQLAGAEADLAG